MAFSLWTLAGVLLLVGYTVAFTHTTDGDSGEECGPLDRKCLAGKATCDPVTDDCVCNNPPWHYGDGYINCYKNNTFRTEVFNDPNVLTYNGNSIGLPLPCRYFWTHTKTWLKNKKRERVGFCEFQAYAFHLKNRGKFYIGGYDVAIKLTYDDGRVHEMSIRKWGKANNGDYTFIVNGTDGQFNPQGPWEDDIIDYHDPGTNLRIKCEFDAQNNLAIIHAKKCGIRIQFRPYDCVLKKNQPQVPHIAYEVNCAFHPMFLNMDYVVAIPPKEDHGGMTIDDILIPGLDREQTLTYRALYSWAQQNSPYPNPECAAAPDHLDNCDAVTLASAFQNCFWILKLPRFIRCWDPTNSGVLIMALFNRCVDIYCNGGDCHALINDIILSGCDNLVPPYPEVDLFVSGALCP